MEIVPLFVHQIQNLTYGVNVTYKKKSRTEILNPKLNKTIDSNVPKHTTRKIPYIFVPLYPASFTTHATSLRCSIIILLKQKTFYFIADGNSSIAIKCLRISTAMSNGGNDPETLQDPEQSDT